MALAPGAARDVAFRSLTTERGAFAMVAIDQRESLRTMLAGPSGRAVSDAEIVAFKLDVVRELGGHASAVLVDRQYGLGPIRESSALSPGTGLIIAADLLVQPAGGAVEDTSIDEGAVEAAIAAGAHALKFLVVCRPETGPIALEPVHRFVDLCRSAGLLSVVEGVVRDSSGAAPADAILDAARQLAATEPDIYKAQVPTLGQGSSAEIERISHRMTEVVARPWVVLSSGVPPLEFPRAVAAACRGGASGFLAGRAIWTGALAQGEPARYLREVTVPALVQLRDVVHGEARPWNVTGSWPAEPAVSPAGA